MTTPPPMYCSACGQVAEDCECPPGVRHLLVLPQAEPTPPPPRRRSVVGTTVLVLVTLFIIVPVALIVGAQVLGSASSADPGGLGALLVVAVLAIIAAIYVRTRP